MVRDSRQANYDSVNAADLDGVFFHRNGRETQRPAGSDDGPRPGPQSADTHRKQVRWDMVIGGRTLTHRPGDSGPC